MGGKRILGEDPFSKEQALPPLNGNGAGARGKSRRGRSDGGDRADEGPISDDESAAKMEGKEQPGNQATAHEPPAAEPLPPPPAPGPGAARAKVATPSPARPAPASVSSAGAQPQAASATSTAAPEPEPLAGWAPDATPVSDRLSPQVAAPGNQAPGAAAADYGPSIDREAPAGHRHGLLEEAQHLERRVREKLLPQRFRDEASERRRLPLEFVWKRFRALAMRDRSDVVDEFGRDPQVAARVEPLLEFLYKSYFRVDAQGMGHIPDEGRALIVSNHSGTLPYDGAMIMHAVRHQHSAHRQVRPLVEDFVFHFPYLGTLMNRIGGVRACPENAERLLGQETLVAVFPEGIKGIGKLYRERYQLQRFGRGGFIKLALKCDAPIIPTAVVGAEEIHPMVTKVTWLAKSFGIPYIPVTPTFPWLGPIGLLPLPTKWFLAFGEPLYFNTEYGPEGANDRILVNKLAEQVRQRIQEMIDALLKGRRSVLFG